MYYIILLEQSILAHKRQRMKKLLARKFIMIAFKTANCLLYRVNERNRKTDKKRLKLIGNTDDNTRAVMANSVNVERCLYSSTNK